MDREMMPNVCSHGLPLESCLDERPGPRDAPVTGRAAEVWHTARPDLAAPVAECRIVVPLEAELWRRRGEAAELNRLVGPQRSSDASACRAIAERHRVELEVDPDGGRVRIRATYPESDLEGARAAVEAAVPWAVSVEVVEEKAPEPSAAAHDFGSGPRLYGVPVFDASGHMCGTTFDAPRKRGA